MGHLYITLYRNFHQRYFGNFISKHILSTNLPPYRYVSDSNILLVVLIVISSFMHLKNLHIPQSKFINIIGSSTFGVLPIHSNSDTMRKWL